MSHSRVGLWLDIGQTIIFLDRPRPAIIFEASQQIHVRIREFQRVIVIGHIESNARQHTPLWRLVRLSRAQLESFHLPLLIVINQ